MNKKWLYLLGLSLIWGTSYILIKKGLVGLTQLQLGALRLVLTSLILFSFGLPSLKKIKKHHWRWIGVSALAGTFFPSFLFAYAQRHIDSAVASILNGLTPLATAIIGMVLFGVYVSKRQLLGVLIGLLGSVMLILAGSQINPDQNHAYGILVLIASMGYALNVNIIKHHLSGLPARAIATGNFVCLFLPALAILWSTNFFDQIGQSASMQISVGYIALLALFGTALASILFNKLIEISSPVFASSVTYTMPLVAVMWGFVDGERFGLVQVLSAAVVFLGVYLANQRQKNQYKTEKAS